MNEHIHIWDKSARSYIPCMTVGCSEVFDGDSIMDVEEELKRYKKVAQKAKLVVAHHKKNLGRGGSIPKILDDAVENTDLMEHLDYALKELEEGAE